MVLKNKNNPLKPNTDLKEIVNKKVNKGVPLAENEWSGIIHTLYVPEDAGYLKSAIMNFIRKVNFEKNLDFNTYSGNTKNKTREEIIKKKNDEQLINYNDFLRIILDHQIKCRSKYLNNLVVLFNELDNDSNGILNEDEFIQLVANTDQYNEGFAEHSNRLLNIIDKNNYKQVTFSQVVNCFAKENIKVYDSEKNFKKINLLDKISHMSYNNNENQN